MSQRYLYHVTPADNLASIQLAGLDPNRATGARPLVWLVTSSMIPWATMHTCRRHRVTTGSLYVCHVTVDHARLLRTNKRGVWACPDRLPIQWAIHIFDLPDTGALKR
jgi:hypothetical protein